MANFIESFGVEGEFKSVSFDYADSPCLAHGHLYKLGNTVGVIFVADKLDPVTGCRVPFTVCSGETGVLIYSCEKIRLQKAAVAIAVGNAIYWDGVHGNPVTNVWASGLLEIAKCVEAAAAGDDDVLADLHGDMIEDEVAP